MKAPVTPRALLARINRKLAKDYEAVRCCREDARGFRDLGRYYLLNTYQNRIIDTHLDLKDFARSHECIRVHEALVEV